MKKVLFITVFLSMAISAYAEELPSFNSMTGAGSNPKEEAYRQVIGLVPALEGADNFLKTKSRDVLSKFGLQKVHLSLRGIRTDKFDLKMLPFSDGIILVDCQIKSDYSKVSANGKLNLPMLDKLDLKAEYNYGKNELQATGMFSKKYDWDMKFLNWLESIKPRF